MQAQCWLDSNGNYYEGDKQTSADVTVPRRPDATCIWNGSAWVKGAPAPVVPTPDQARLAALESAVGIITQTLPPATQAQIAVAAPAIATIKSS